jgi:lipid-A-disaccharide synthase-like uncharacterized protein
VNDLSYWFWEAVGLFGYCLFFSRLVIQWAMSERERRPVLPVVYWYLSIAGALIVLVYGVHRRSIAVAVPQLVGLLLYARQLWLDRAHRAWERWRRAVGFEAPGYAWPSISLVIPVHNEAAALGPTLRSAAALEDPGGGVETVVALNGCTDGSRAVAEEFGVRVVEESASGMSFGKNLGARAARGDILVFLDADTTLRPDALRRIAETFHGRDAAVATAPGRPDRGGGVVRAGFLLANRYARRGRVAAPGGLLAVRRSVWEAVGGFDESLPQGTSSDFIMRALAAGAEYLYLDRVPATTSIRRFRRTGILRQLFSWRANHLRLRRGERGPLSRKPYEAVR